MILIKSSPNVSAGKEKMLWVEAIDREKCSFCKDTKKTSYFLCMPITFLPHWSSNIKLYLFSWETVLFSRYFQCTGRIFCLQFFLRHHLIEIFYICKKSVFMKVLLLAKAPWNLHMPTRCCSIANRPTITCYTFFLCWYPFFSFLTLLTFLIFIQLTNIQRPQETWSIYSFFSLVISK